MGDSFELHHVVSLHRMQNHQIGFVSLRQLRKAQTLGVYQVDHIQQSSSHLLKDQSGASDSKGLR